MGEPGQAAHRLELADATALDAAAAIRDGRLTAVELVAACLDRIKQREPVVQAWAHLDADHARRQADAADLAQRHGRPLGPLHGIPVGVKDIFDTRDLPTENGTVLHAGRQPTRDATAVALLRQAGAIILGKTVTTELAVYSPGKTTNPHDSERTPGGSSSGSAAAVAAGMVPLAIGTQTNGSVIRPASYCGVVGFKPSFGQISRHGVLPISPNLDQVGVFARTIADAALIADSLIGYDENDPETRPRAHPRLLETALEPPPLAPRLAFIRTPAWDHADDDTQAAFAEIVDHLGDNVDEVQLPSAFDHAVDRHARIMETELAVNFAREYTHGRERLSARLVEMIERGNGYRAVDYVTALGTRRLLNAMLAEVFNEFDAVLTPSTTGVAPRGLQSTGSPVFCTLWSYCGLPAISLPLLQGEHGLPLGAQLVAAWGDDARLLRTAFWLANSLSQ